MKQKITGYSYEIIPRPVDLGGGWRLCLLEGSVEVGGGVFPPVEGIKDAKEAVQAAFDDAEVEACAWLDSRDAADVSPDSYERQRRQDAVDFGLANVKLSGFTPSEEARHHMQRFIDGEIKFDEVIKGILDDAKRKLDGC